MKICSIEIEQCNQNADFLYNFKQKVCKETPINTRKSVN